MKTPTLTVPKQYINNTIQSKSLSLSTIRYICAFQIIINIFHTKQFSRHVQTKWCYLNCYFEHVKSSGYSWGLFSMVFSGVKMKQARGKMKKSKTRYIFLKFSFERYFQFLTENKIHWIYGLHQWSIFPINLYILFSMIHYKEHMSLIRKAYMCWVCVSS